MILINKIVQGLTLWSLWIIQVFSETQEICVGEDFQGQCPEGEAILLNEALYGRMEMGLCVKSDFGHLGCKNDVLGLADTWCSGRRECAIFVPNDDLKNANTACNPDLSQYMGIDYTCVPVISPPTSQCTGQHRITHKGSYISSHVTQQTGCGSKSAPWVISAKAGQTIDISLLDFGALQRQKGGLYSSCAEVYGFILERSLGVNHTLCGGQERRSLAYKSKTNTVEIQVLRSRQGLEQQAGFMLEYSFVGCSDLTPPAEAWYKREGSEAVIGCKSNDRVWRLSCHGNTWDGVVGNCSTKGAAKDESSGLDFSFSSVIFLTGVVCAAFLLVIVVVVAGSVYIKKQSIKHEIKLRSEYSAATLSPSQYYATKSRCDTGGSLDTSSQPLVHVHDRTLVHVHDRTLPVGLQHHTLRAAGPVFKQGHGDLLQ